MDSKQQRDRNSYSSDSRKNFGYSPENYYFGLEDLSFKIYVHDYYSRLLLTFII